MPASGVFCFVIGLASWGRAQTPVPQVAPSPPVAPAPTAASAPALLPPVPPPAAQPAAAPVSPGYPPPFSYPPPGYGYGYPPPPRAPDSIPYDGGPVPPGYHVEERARRGMLIAGPIVMGVPYLLGLTIASSENFPNSTSWLALPVLGPWLTLASRHRSDSCSNDFNSCSDGSLDSGIDSTTRTFLVLDGVMQTAGAVMFIYGLASPRKVIARNFIGSLQWSPSQFGRTGYGGVLAGSF
jgi:hypothetical protein